MPDFEISIDRDKCTDCGLCVRDCVAGVILERDGKPEAENPKWCNLCGHCRAVCPAEAITHSGLAGRPAREFEKKAIDPASYRAIVLGRRSVRLYRDEELSREEIEDILEVASYSPTASNTLDVGYTVIDDRELIRRTGENIFNGWRRLKKTLDKPWGKALLAGYIAITGNRNIARYVDRFELYATWMDQGRNVVTHNAPALILIHAPQKGRFNDANCHIAAANITNYAFARGLGTCYLGLVVIALDRDRKLAARLGVPEGRRAYQVLALGRPAYKYRNAAARPGPAVTWL